MTSSNFYTYAYLRKRDNTPYYVGKGNGRRAFVKHEGISVPKDRSKIIFLKQNLTEEEAFKHEIYMISIFGRKDLGTGILLNRTNGGDGVSGHVKTKKQIEANKKTGKSNHEKGLGVHAFSKEERSGVSKKSGKIAYEKGLGVHALTKEEKSKNGKKARDLGVGVHGLTKEERIENAKKGGKVGGKVNYEKSLGLFSRSKEKINEDCKKGGRVASSQKWQCTITGYVSNAGGLTHYQRARDIDTLNRIRIQ
jgi:hypothetical protein